MTNPLPPSETYAACLTPPGVAALATLAVRGPRAWQVLRELYRPRSTHAAGLPAEPVTGRVWLGRLGTELADEVVLAVTRTAPVPWVELHCHGGREVVRLLLVLLQAQGVQVCSWQQLERLTADDPLRTEAALALTEALTGRTAAILLDQYHGAFGRAAAEVLAALDRGNAADAQRQLDELARWTAVGRHLTSPWRVAVAGAPNVGKSSLLNALAGYQRSVVSALPGTTRDVVTTLIAVDGWPIELADTAGQRGEAEALEKQGIGLAQMTVASADLCLWVLDAAAPPIWPSFPSGPLRLVVNKLDLPAAWNLDEAVGAVRVSARTGTGLSELGEALAGWLVPQPPPAGAAVPFTSQMCQRVEGVRRQLSAGCLAEARQKLVELLSWQAR
jgi:tRNA modification GTPase